MGVNNRNLHDLSVDIQRVAQITQHYADQIPPGTKIISESGIYQHQQIRDLRHVADGFLIGSSLMQHADLNHAVRSLLFGEHKVCGLTRPQDVRAVYQQGALYGGLIFVTHSKRCISLRQAQELVTQAPLRFVGVFQDQ
ncbi:bifunctional indole-3-glycerol phosphate synthase/phosphoribosylanthranilate isomerase, partial [Pasteurella multocida subsp. multocida str. Anand1_cattle]